MRAGAANARGNRCASPGAARACLCAGLLVLALTGQAAPDPAGTLDALLASYDRESAAYFPLGSSDLGLREYDGMLADNLSERYRAGLRALCAGYLAKAKSIGRESLDRQRRLSHEIFQHELERCVERLNYPWHLLPISQAGSSMPSRFSVIGSGK